MKKITGIMISLLWVMQAPLFAAEPTVAKHGMVASEQHLASQIGADVLRSGGNAIDAAVAVGYALAVVNPCCGNIGGGGLMTIHLANGQNVFLNFRERAPLAATQTMFLDAQGHVIPGKSSTGYLSVATPGTVMGLDVALKKYGTMSLKQLMAPAIKLAEQGYTLTSGDIKLLNEHREDFKKEPNVAAIFLKNKGPYHIGDRLVQKDLARTLKKIAKQGPDAFYKGDIAAAVVKASQAHGGILSLRDFAEYTVEESPPVTCTYHDYTVISAAPPSSGGTSLCEILNIVEAYPLTTLGVNSAQSVHDIAEAMRRAFYDRNNQLGDPNFVTNPIAQLTSKAYAEQLRSGIDPFKATPSSQFSTATSPHESMQTTHYSVLDRYGNAVSVTYTLDSFFGSDLIAGDTGFFLNNEMNDFTTKAGEANQFGLVEGTKNLIAPGKRPLSSMTPTILLKDNQVAMVVGGPGGPFIITTTLLTILNVIDFKMDLQAAVNAPRFHHQWMPDVLLVEPDTFSLDLQQQLTERGYTLVVRKPWGAVEAIYVDPVSKLIYGANDKRRTAGAARGH